MPAALVVGDIVLDRYLHGTVEGLSLECSAPVVSGSSEVLCLGGAGNVAANIVSLGGRVCLLGVAGRDPARELLTKLATDKGIPHVITAVDGGRTRMHERTVVAGGTLLRYDRAGPSYTSESGILNAATTCMDHAESDIKLLVIADYAYGLMTQSLAEALVRAAAERRIPIYVDAPASHANWYSGATLYGPTLREALRYLDAAGNPHPGLGVADVVSVASTAAKELCSSGRFWGVVVMCGRDGAAIATRASVTYYPGKAVPCLDSTGAGETFIAGLAVGLLEGRSPDASVQLANLASSMATQQQGTAAIRRFDIEGASTDVVVTLPQALAYVKHVRAAGRTFALASGCFDCLHAGHIDLLTAAATFADVLLVAFNDDASLVAQKGPNRPLVPNYLRAMHLAQVRCVSRVFDYPGDPVALVRQFHPDVYVKGADTLGRGPVPAADVVAGYGGRVEFVKNTTPAHSEKLLR